MCEFKVFVVAVMEKFCQNSNSLFCLEVSYAVLINGFLYFLMNTFLISDRT